MVFLSDLHSCKMVLKDPKLLLEVFILILILNYIASRAIKKHFSWEGTHFDSVLNF